MLKKIIVLFLIFILFGNIVTAYSFNKSLIEKNVLNNSNQLEIINKMDGNTIYVDDDNTQGPWDGTIDNPYKEIWKGIEEAKNGDTVYVFSGTYTYVETTIKIDKSITLEGESKHNTIIDGYKNGNVIEINANNVVLHSFNIKNSGEGYSGISISSDSNIIFDNIISENSKGIYIESYTIDNKIYENNFIKNGIVTHSTNRQNIYDNRINDKNLVYVFSESNKEIKNAGQIIVVDSSDIFLKNNDISFASIGIIILESESCYIRNNDISNNKYGIFISSSSVWIDDIFREAESYNNIYENDIGIYSMTSKCVISNNKIYSNNLAGILLSDSDECNIIKNRIYENDLCGINLKYYSEENHIYENYIINNIGAGIYLESNSNENKIYHNQFFYNNPNAKSSRCQNTWDTICSSIGSGNYWSDYESTYQDAVNDGYTWNMAYGISEDEKDNFPLVDPYGTPFPPVLSGPKTAKINVEYTYSAKAEDPQLGDELYYYFDWGDGTNSGWIGPVDQINPIQEEHIWSKEGSFEIKAKVKDKNNWTSQWSEPLKTSVSKSKEYKNNILSVYNFLYKFLRNISILEFFI